MVALLASAGELSGLDGRGGEAGPGGEAVLACPVCNADGEGPGEEGCEGCDGSGVFGLTESVDEFVSADIWQCINLADLAKRGTMPVAGGSLDQANSFLAACRLVWNEQARIRDALEARALKGLK